MKPSSQLVRVSQILQLMEIPEEINGLRWWGTRSSNSLFSTGGTGIIRTQVGNPWFLAHTRLLITREAVGNKLLRQNVSNAALRVQASKAHLQTMIRLNPCQKGEAPQETLASTVEALVGAVWFDCGGDIDIVRGIMERLGIFRHE